MLEELTLHDIRCRSLIAVCIVSSHVNTHTYVHRKIEEEKRREVALDTRIEITTNILNHRELNHRHFSPPSITYVYCNEYVTNRGVVKGIILYSTHTRSLIC